MNGKYLFYKEIDSTNTECQRILAKAGALHEINGELTQEGKNLSGTVVASVLQTAGRGRLNRQFYSPEGKGIYFSIIYVPRFGVTDAALYTTSAAVCVRRVINELSGKNAFIKWVNDIYVNQKKVCGILSEGYMCPGSRIIDAVIIGIGINLYEDKQMPPDVIQKAGSVFSLQEEASFVEKCSGYKDLFQSEWEKESVFSLGQAVFLKKCVSQVLDVLDSEQDIIPEYRQYSLVTGKKVLVTPVIGQYEGVFEATVIDITNDAGLLVELPDGSRKEFHSGEISLHSM